MVRFWLRDEAPTYAQEIVSSVFMEIQDNPGSRRAAEPAAAREPCDKEVP